MVRRGYAGVGLAMLASCHALAAQPADKAQFAAEMIHRLKAAAPDKAISQTPGDPLQVHIGSGPKDGGTVNLDRIWTFCQTADASDCEGTKARFVRGILEPHPAASIANLRVIVRPDDYARMLAGTLSGHGGILMRPLADGLSEIVGSDAPNSTQIVTADMLDKLGLSDTRAWDLAEAQTAAHLPKLPSRAQLSQQPVFITGYDYEASLLVQRAEWAQLAKDAGPDLAVTAVSDGLVVVAIMPDGPGLDRWANGARAQCAQNERCISPYVWRWRGAKWVPATAVPNT